MTSAQVFISYSSKDLVVATEVADAFAERGIGTFFAARSLASGTKYPEEIMNAIDTCDVFVFLLSHAAMDSEDVRNEFTQATRQRKPRLPFMLGGLLYPRDVTRSWDYFLTHVQVKPFETEHQVVEAASKYLTTESCAAEAPRPDPEPKNIYRSDDGQETDSNASEFVSPSTAPEAIHVSETDLQKCDVSTSPSLTNDPVARAFAETSALAKELTERLGRCSREELGEIYYCLEDRQSRDNLGHFALLALVVDQFFSVWNSATPQDSYYTAKTGAFVSKLATKLSNGIQSAITAGGLDTHSVESASDMVEAFQCPEPTAAISTLWLLKGLALRETEPILPAKQATKAPIFISYSQQHLSIAKSIADTLATQDIGCFYTKLTPHKDADYDSEVSRNIRDCTMVIALISRASLGSQTLQRELALARDHQKALVPFIIGDSFSLNKLPAHVQYLLAGTQPVHYRDPTQVVATANQVLSSKPGTDVVGTDSATSTRTSAITPPMSLAAQQFVASAMAYAKPTAANTLSALEKLSDRDLAAVMKLATEVVECRGTPNSRRGGAATQIAVREVSSNRRRRAKQPWTPFGSDRASRELIKTVVIDLSRLDDYSDFSRADQKQILRECDALTQTTDPVTRVTARWVRLYVDLPRPTKLDRRGPKLFE